MLRLPSLRSFLTARRRRSRRPRRFNHVAATAEVLERRLLLAGNVRAAAVGGDLVIEGDGDDNEIALVLRDGDLVIRGTGGTTINGTDSFVAQAGSTIGDDLRIRMGAGNDIVLVGPGISVDGDVSIDTGSGDDLLNMNDFSVGGDLTITAGEGDDSLLLSGVTVGDDQRIDGGSGANTVQVENGSIRDNLWIRTGAGRDVVAVRDSSVGDNGELFSGDGDDSLGAVGSTAPRQFEIIGGRGDNDVLRFAFQFDTLARLNNALNRVAGLIKPQAGDDQFTVGSEEDFLSVPAGSGLLANDQPSPFGDALSLRLETGPTGGSVSLNPDGSFEYSPDPDFSGTDQFTYVLTNPFGGTAEGTVEIEVQPLRLDVDLSANDADTIPSSGTLLTRDAAFQIQGQTAAGATVEIDRDGDGAFDDGSATADASGFFSVDVTLVHNDDNQGANNLQVRSTSTVARRRANFDVDVHFAVGTVVRMETPLGNYDIELLDDDAPVTVENFLNYLDSSRYENLIVHRSPGTFVVQAGGFTFENVTTPEFFDVPRDDPIQNEFNPANSNVRGTLSMALAPNQEDSGTSEWFINTVDNSFLDANKHTVFGRVIGTGMEVADAIDALPTTNLVAEFGVGALRETPLVGYTDTETELTGIVSIPSNSDQVFGQGTSFTTEIPGVGATIRVEDQVFRVVEIVSDTRLRVDAAHPSGVFNADATVSTSPVEDHILVFEDISRILEP